LIVPNPPGALPDTIARIIGRQLQDRLGQSVVVENKPGASAGLGTAALTTSPPDGYTLLVTDGAILSINPLLSAKLPYAPTDVLPVALLARAPLFLAASKNVPVASMKELIEYAKSNPGRLNFGSIGTGSFHYLTMEAMNSALGLSMKHIPYKGSAETTGALLGGHIDLLFASYAAIRSAVEANKVVLLAMNGAERSSDAPDVPTVAEFVPGFDLAVIQGIYARTGTPTAIVRKVAAEVAAIIKDPEVLRQYKIAGIEPASGGPEEFAAALKSEADRIAKVVQSAGLKTQ
jgi:tripartite-type tricarboxylate transporter receptor subunit TctC